VNEARGANRKTANRFQAHTVFNHAELEQPANIAFYISAGNSEIFVVTWDAAWNTEWECLASNWKGLLFL